MQTNVDIIYFNLIAPCKYVSSLYHYMYIEISYVLQIFVLYCYFDAYILQLREMIDVFNEMKWYEWNEMELEWNRSRMEWE